MVICVTSVVVMLLVGSHIMASQILDRYFYCSDCDCGPGEPTEMESVPSYYELSHSSMNYRGQDIY